MKKLLLLISIIFVFCQIQAQEQAVYTHYHINPILINPAASGADGLHKVMMNVRNQWTGFTGSPKTYSLTYQGPVGKTFGFGATFFKEDIASISRLRFALSYAFQYELDKIKFGFGFSTEFSRLDIDNSVLNNSLTDPNDPTLQDGVDGISIFDATFGIRGMYNHSTYFGIAFPNIIRARLDEDPGNQNASNNENDGFFVFNAGHRFRIPEWGAAIEPSFMVRKNRNVPFQTDLTVKGLFMEEKLIGGVTYRGGAGGAFAILVGTKIDAFEIYYSYDVSFGDFQSYSSGSHEVTLSFSFGKKEDDIKNRR